MSSRWRSFCSARRACSGRESLSGFEEFLRPARGERWREAPDEGQRRPLRKSLRRPSPRPSPRKRGEGVHGSLTCSIAKPVSTRRPTRPTWRSSRSARTAIGLALILVVAFVADPGVRQSVPPQHDDDPVPDPLAGGDRAQPADRIYRPVVARNRRLHGRRRLCLLQARDDLPAGQHSRLDHRQRRSSRRWSASSSACRACASRASIWRWRRWRRSSFSNGASPACPGSSTITTPGRSRCRPRPCSAWPSPVRPRRQSRAISSS